MRQLFDQEKGVSGGWLKRPCVYMMKRAKIAEIFESLQGEGVYAGARQVFVRFFGCNLSCVFCDTPLKRFKEYSLDDLKKKILKFNSYHSLCLTGGEPLLQADFLKDFLKEFSVFGKKIYLETNGTLVDGLLKVLDFVDIIAMDFKLPSTTGCGAYWKEHEEFLAASLAKDVFVKIVISRQTQKQDISAVCAIIKKIKPEVSVVLQPHGRDLSTRLLDRMDLFREEFLRAGIGATGVMPQMHKLAGIR
jgi:7-carboxy-7-deazaguanine synthase